MSMTVIMPVVDIGPVDVVMQGVTVSVLVHVLTCWRVIVEMIVGFVVMGVKVRVRELVVLVRMRVSLIGDGHHAHDHQ